MRGIPIRPAPPSPQETLRTAMDSALRTALVISGYANWQWRLATLTYIPDIGVRAFGVAGQRNDYLLMATHDTPTIPAVVPLYNFPVNDFVNRE